MNMEKLEKRQTGLSKFDRFKLGIPEMRSIKRGYWLVYYIDGKLYVEWVEEDQ